MATILEALAIAHQHHQAGRLQVAEQICRQILQAEPNRADTWHLLGVISAQTGNHQRAVEYINRALALKSDWSEAHINLGNVLGAEGKSDEAVACYRRALKLKPNLAEAHHNLGTALKVQGKLDEAVACYRRALQLKPNLAEGHDNLGSTLQAQGKLDEAVACCQRALKLKPNLADAHHNLGTVLASQGKLDEAVACYRRALELKPNSAEARTNLGTALGEQGKVDEAVACYRRALELKPDLADAHHNLGTVLAEQGKLNEAVACYRRALELKPNLAEAYNNLGNTLKGQGKLDEAIARYRRALELKPDLATIHSNLLLTLHYCAAVTPAALAEAHAEYDRQHAAPLRDAIMQHENVHDRHGRLRLGFVSPDLGRHAVSFFLIRVLENLSQVQHETIFYSDRRVKDDVTHRLQASATQWRDAFGMSDQRLAEQIRADRIDILFDLSGHTAGNRLLVFARKPAPIQITWIGYTGTTGLAAMDYLLADGCVVPEGTEHYYRERVLRMPDGYLCYNPPDAAPPVGPLPSLTKGYTTFGSFNNPAKITPQVVAVWAEILRRVPSARLVLKYSGLSEPTVKRRYLDLFATHGVEPQRLELQPSSLFAEYLATYQQVDVALDPFPFSGCTTTCEALWMGVPVSMCSFLGTPGHAVGVGNGTDALAIALRAFGLEPGDEVITVSNTAVATVSAIRMAGATPVFCDVDPQTLLMDPVAAAKRITGKTKAILPVHLFGNAVDMKAVLELAGRHRLRVIEDCAQSCGTLIHGCATGTWGDVGCFSFYPTKNLGAYGDGGLCFTRDEELAASIRRIRSYGCSATLVSQCEGVNSRLDEVQAAVLEVKLRYLPDHLRRRRHLATVYREHLAPEFAMPSTTAGAVHSYHLLVIQTDQRDRVISCLREECVEHGIHYPVPVHQMDTYRFLGYEKGSLPVTETAADRILSLPLYPELSTSAVEKVCSVVNRSIGQ